MAAFAIDCIWKRDSDEFLEWVSMNYNYFSFWFPWRNSSSARKCNWCSGAATKWQWSHQRWKVNFFSWTHLRVRRRSEPRLNWVWCELFAYECTSVCSQNKPAVGQQICHCVKDFSVALRVSSNILVPGNGVIQCCSSSSITLCSNHYFQWEIFTFPSFFLSYWVENVL